MNNQNTFMDLGFLDQDYALGHLESESNFWIQPSALVLSERETCSSEFLVLPEVPLQPSISNEAPWLRDGNMGEGCHGERKADEVEDKETQSGGILKGHACSRKKLTHKLKRTRSTHEIRNVSERRRRDRINGKVRALQELIPHCTKTDRASILEDAVEYIKTLKLQSEMMTKPTGVGCLAPYISCSGHPVMQLPSLSSFVPIGPGIGMGIGMACGAGMSYMGSCARGAPLIQLPAVSLSPSAIVGFPFSTMYATTAVESGEMGALSEAHPSRSRGSYAAAGSSISYGLHSGGLALKK